MSEPSTKAPSAWSVSATGTHLERAGRPEFLLADTAWAAFPRARLDEWRRYLDHRRGQGFTAVLLSVLPIPHGRSVGADDRHPFARDAAGRWDLDRTADDYFTTARQLASDVVAAELTPVPVLVWNNYVPGTWGARLTPHTAMTAEQTHRYLDVALDTFAGLDVIFAVSGDEAFADATTAQRYTTVLDRVRTAAPGRLVTAHTATGDLPPPELSTRLDLHGYQSGHDRDQYARCADLAGRLRRRQPRRPVVNLEPCYEDHLCAGTGHRYTAADVRASSWASVLGGATAGLGYGAHGVWSWHRAGDHFTDVGFAGEPAPVDRAMRLPGADDAAFLRHLVTGHDLLQVEPRPDLAADVGGPVAATPDGSTLVAYLPAGGQPVLPVEFADHRMDVVELATRSPGRAVRVADGKRVRVRPVEPVGDRLYVWRR